MDILELRSQGLSLTIQSLESEGAFAVLHDPDRKVGLVLINSKKARVLASAAIPPGRTRPACVPNWRWTPQCASA